MMMIIITSNYSIWRRVPPSPQALVLWRLVSPVDDPDYFLTFYYSSPDSNVWVDNSELTWQQQDRIFFRILRCHRAWNFLGQVFFFGVHVWWLSRSHTLSKGLTIIVFFKFLEVFDKFSPRTRGCKPHSFMYTKPWTSPTSGLETASAIFTDFPPF